MHNFEWLASSTFSLGIDEPYLANGIVRIPILLDDFALHRGVDYEQWQADGMAALERHRTVVFSLHDCYADRWLASYRDLLGQVADLGRVRTLNEVAADTLLAHSL